MRVATGLMVSRALYRLVGQMCAVLVCALGSVVGAPAARAQDDCEPGWTGGLFCEAGVNDTVRAAVTWDDGSGEALYVGGDFTIAGCETVNSIARWDGSNWSALTGPGGEGVNNIVSAMAVFDDGTGPALYVGGPFTTAGGMTVNRIARWDGTSWSALAGPSYVGVNNSVYAMAVFDDGSGPALFVAGDFTAAGGVIVNRIAKWNGSAWSVLSGPSGVGVNGSVSAMTVFDDGSGPALFVAGDFTAAGGVTVNRIAKWNGATWSALSGPSGVGVNNSVYEMVVFDDGTGPALYVGGFLTTAGGVTVNRIARWDGASWFALAGPGGVGVNSFVNAMAVFDDGSGPALYAAGNFTTAGGVTVLYVARWNGSTWSALVSPGGVGVGSIVEALAVFDDGSGPALYAGGWFTAAGGVMAHRIARWDGAAWSALVDPGGLGVNGNINALAVFDDGSGPALYAAHNLPAPGGGSFLYRVSRWDGAAWSALAGPGGPSWNDRVLALTVFDDGAGAALYASGHFTTAGGVTVNRVARWNGTAWSALVGPSGEGVNGTVRALAVFDDGSGPALYVGGNFFNAGGVAATRVARWDGSAWSALVGPSGMGVNSGVADLEVFDDGSGPALYAGGIFTTAGGVTVNRVARWDGSTWSALTGPSGVGVSDTVNALTAFDDGTGPALYAGGRFMSAGGLTVNRIARWDGRAWSGLLGPGEVGVSVASTPIVLALTTHDDGSGPALYAAGSFQIAGGVVSMNIARWPGCTPPPACPPDVNDDGELDILDFLDFIDSLGACENQPAPCAGSSGVSADYNGDTLVDILDFLDFIDAFGTGCG
jgi:hypothetical protein